MPKPNPGEEKNHYISRCVEQLIKEEGYKQDQALAICYRYWSRDRIKECLDDKLSVKEALDKEYQTKADKLLKYLKKDKKNKSTSGWECKECGKKFKTTAAVEKASMDGCPKCGGVDVDLED